VYCTLSGFVANKRHGLEHVILFARKLKNVKVWCNDTTTADTPICISVPKHSSNRSQSKIMWCTKRMEHNRRNEAIFDFIRILETRSKTLESVSMVSSGLCQDFLGSLEGPCSISSIKLRGNLDRLPASDKLSELGRIKKLQLFSTGLTIKELSVLQYLRGLEYLKLVEYSDRFSSGIFIVEKKGFESLNRLHRGHHASQNAIQRRIYRKSNAPSLSLSKFQEATIQNRRGHPTSCKSR